METTLEIADPSQVAVVRRVVAEHCRALALGEADTGRAVIVGAEAATNILKYGGRGTIAVSRFDELGASGVQMIASDAGPGMDNFTRSARDGHSTGGSLGIGLGAVMRASDAFDVYTAEGRGTILFSRIARDRQLHAPPPGTLVVGSRATPKLGQDVSGDSWASCRAGRWQRICVVDGLGHGPLAQTASILAVQVFLRAAEGDSPADILDKAHRELRSGRGAVMSILCVDTAAGTCVFAGVGNIAGLLQRATEPAHMMPMEGIVGYNMRPPRNHEWAWTPDTTAVLSSDGLSTRWTTARYPSLFQKHPTVVAATLHRDLAKDSDDATIVVARAAP